MRLFLSFFLMLYVAMGVSAQDPQLAYEYYRNGEYEKSSTLYKILYDKNPRQMSYFNKYIESLIYLEKYEEATQIIQKKLKEDPNNLPLYVTQGNLLEKQFKEEEAKEQYQKAISHIGKERFKVSQLARAFKDLQKYDYAIATYKRGAEKLKKPNSFAFNIADLYRRKGDSTPEMISYYLKDLDGQPTRLAQIKMQFQRYLEEEDYFELQAQLYSLIQENPKALHYNEMLVWVFVQNKDYVAAFRQVKALDRQGEENGGRIFRLAEIAKNDKAWQEAIEAYEYVVAEKGPTSVYYLEAKREALGARRSQLTEGYDYTLEDLRILESQYIDFLEEFGKNKTTASIIMELANLEAFYLNDHDKAIQLLNELIRFPGLKPEVQARAKISLADFYLMKGEVWESTLLYSQVDKAHEDDMLGHEARFKNAKLAYYSNDFQWAQTQFDILKASTSKLIANDALDLSIFIMDNMGLDTTTTPLQYYAEADLLIFQNKFDKGFSKLDSITSLFPDHSLEDDIYYLKAQVFTKKREYDKAVEYYQKIVDKYIEGIRGDNALYEMARIYDYQLKDPEKAKSLYEKLFLDLSGSTLAVEARKRYRALRGDENIQ